MASTGTNSAMPWLAGLPDCYARWRRSRLGRITDRLQQHLLLGLLGPLDGLAVLDVGCGDGALAAELARHGARVTGVDAEPRMLAAARSRSEVSSIDIDLARGRAEALPFADSTFDRVVAVTVLCFVPEPDRAVAEMSRVLKPGGRIVVGELGRWSPWALIRRIRGWLGSPTWRRARFRTAREMRHLVERHGLKVEETRGAIYYPPCGALACVMAAVDPWFGRKTTLGAAFVVLAAAKPPDHTE